MSILIIPLITCSIYYSHSYKVIKEETMVRQHLSLENVKTQLDNSLNDLIRISTNLRMNQQVSSLSNKTTSTPDTHLLIKKLHDELSIYMITNSFIKEIYIYFPSCEYIVSSSTVYKYQMTNYMPTRYISEMTWQYLYNNLNKNTYPVLLSEQNDSDTQLLFTQALLSSNKTNKPQSIIAFEINRKNLSSLLKSQVLSSNFSALSLFNDDTILLSSDPKITDHLEAITSKQFLNASKNIRSSSTIEEDDSKKVSYIIDSVNLMLSNLNLISLTEENIYYNETSYMLVVLFITLSISILIGIIITCFYSVHNYRPLKEIMSYLKTDPTEPDDKNEYSKIKRMIIRSNSEIQTQRNVIKNNYLQRLLTGEIKFSQVSSNIAEQFHLNFHSDYSFVVLLRCTAFQQVQDNADIRDFKNPKNDLAFFIVQNILSELFQPAFSNLQFCYNQTETVIIVNLTEDIDKSEGLLLEGLNTFIEYCKSHFDIAFFIGVSSLCNHKHLSEAYAQASNTLEYMHLFGVGDLLTYKETPKESQISYLNLKTSD